MYRVFRSLTGEHDWRAALPAGLLVVSGSLALLLPDLTDFRFLLSFRSISAAILATAAVVLVLCFAREGVRRRTKETARRHDIQLDAALNNMSQGLCMFDAAARLVVCNERYLQMYKLSPGVVKPGCGLRDLLIHRAACGTFSITDVDRYIADLLSTIAKGEAFTRTTKLNDGRSIAVVNRPMEGGGWVATHEDITERRQVEKALIDARGEAEWAEQEARAAHARLLEAIEVIPEGIVLFDSEDRFVLWNRRYAELYPDSRQHLKVGARFEDLLRATLATAGINHPDAKGRGEQWIAERLGYHALPQASHEQQLSNGRWIRAEEHRTFDGGSIGVRIDISDLKQREASFRLLFDGNPVPMWLYDQESLRFLAVNDAALEHYGYSREQFLNKTLLDIRPPDDHDEVNRVARTGDSFADPNRTWRHIKADGSPIDVLIYRKSLPYQDRTASLVAVIDVTERKRTEDALQRAQDFLNAVIENVPTTIFVKDARDLRYILLNRAGEKFFGIPRGEIVGKTADDIFHKDGAERVASYDREILESKGEPFLDDHPINTPGNGVRLASSKRIAIRGADGQPKYLLGVIEDVTERKLAEARIAHMAHHDTLTDLPNRAAFNECFDATLERAAAAAEPFAVMCIDLDRFKEVNDVFGHPVGDALLYQVSRRLQAAAAGAFLARLGGDEFIVITADGSQPDNAAQLADRLLAAMNAEIEIEDHHLRSSLSIGVAIYPNDGGDATTLIGNADAALYRAKSDGRGAIRFFEAEMDKRLRDRRALQHDLQSAVARGELILHYQPQALADGEVVGFEALVRWQHPTRGLVPPDAFIPIAEESGLIIPIGEWILREACREAASWPKPLQIGVNLSAVQFRHGDLPGLVHSLLLETRLSPRRLELEITESVLIGDFSRGVSILRRLKALGVRIAMDDFGTGYSSLSYLQSFPLDKLKIDQAFVSNLHRNPQSAAIVRAIIVLGHGLGLSVVAEGVETQEQLDLLTREGCDEMQGYLLGHPRPIGHYADLIGRRGLLEKKRARAG